MINMVTLIGCLTSGVEIKEVNGKKVTTMNIAVNRTFKNMNGEYETDYFDIICWNIIADNCVEYLKKGDLVGIKGRLQTNDNKLEIIAEKVTFLSSKKVGEEDGNN